MIRGTRTSPSRPPAARHFKTNFLPRQTDASTIVAWLTSGARDARDHASWPLRLAGPECRAADVRSR
jgi:hypothetical protein